VAAEYAVFRRGLDALAGLRLAGLALSLYFLESLFVVILLIALMSYVASGLWLFYRARDTRLLLAAPLPLGGLYALRALETFALTSWPLLIVGAPALVALGRAHDQDAAFYLAGGVTLALFAVFTGATGALLTSAAGAALRRAPTRLAVGVAVALLLALFALAVGRHVIPSTADFYTIFEPGILNGKPSSIKFIEARFAFWPTHPFAAALHAGATGSRAGSAASRAALWLFPLAAVVAAATLGRRLYGGALPAIAESFVLAGGGGRAAPVGARTFPRRLRGALGALVERDLLAIVRNPHEWSRAAFLGFLLALYTSFVFVAPLGEVADRPAAVARLLLLNVVASGYFVTAFGLRFVFPSISLEGRAAWVLFSSPVRLARLFFAKLGLFAGLLTVAVVPIALAGTVRLVGHPALVAATAALLVMLVLTTATLLLAFGAAWPDFRESDPESLSTSGGGLAATLVCLGYVAVVGWSARGAALAAAGGGSVAPWLALAAAVSAALIAGALALALRRMRTLEVT
jgi:ABC-2 type transport system permease protein